MLNLLLTAQGVPRDTRVKTVFHADQLFYDSSDNAPLLQLVVGGGRRLGDFDAVFGNAVCPPRQRRAAVLSVDIVEGQLQMILVDAAATRQQTVRVLVVLLYH